MYAASVPLFHKRLEALGGVLDKGAAFAAERGLDPAALLQARLAPDMLPLVRQVQLSSDHAKNGAARLAGVEPPRFPDEETSFPELKDRIARTLAYLDTFRPEQIDGSEGREIVLKTPQAELRFTGQQYLLGFVIPNLLFHCTIAYGLLRQAGVALGKRDFIGGF
jgi:hypothetical protein